MTCAIDRLAQLASLASVPREEVEWLASHGTVRHLDAGEILAARGSQVENMFVVLSGHLSVSVDRNGTPHKVMEWKAGEVAGLLPYSRLTSPPGHNVAQEPTVILAVHRTDLPEMIRECHEITSILVHSMVDRARLSHATELREAKMEAERANRAKSQFLANMSHEIRTPLNAVIGMADVLASSPLTPWQKKCVEVSQRNGIGLLNLINDILDLAKVESGRVELEAIGYDLREVVAEAMEAIEAKASAKGLWLRRTIHPNVPVYRIGDPNRLRQVLMNLLGNALKFTHNGGLEVHVETDAGSDSPAMLRFAVCDTGIGIEPDKVDAVFESFTQADASTTRVYGGTGLGLTISRQLVELMGGRLWLESKVGVGSTFFFTARTGVQESQAERGEKKLQKPTEELERRIAGMRILVADDSEDNRFLVKAYLNGIECSLDFAENGAEAVELFRRNRYDIVLMDGEMPVMDGITAVREIRRIESGNPLHGEATRSTPIFAFTAHAFADRAALAFDAGYTRMLTKPLRRVTLLESLAKYGRTPEPRGAMAAGADDDGHERIVLETNMVEPNMVESNIRDAVPGYLEKRRLDLASCRRALAAGNLTLIAGIGHKIRGTGAGYGFPLLTEIGGRMEAAARHGNTDELKVAIDELASWLGRFDNES
jgi:signal transduction histidine kinase/DNA-binding response OmpR family regulator